MLFPVFTTALLAASVLGAALPGPGPDPTPAPTDDIFALCVKRGIDVAGPIPADATAIPGGFTFTADSDASHWARAQVNLAPQKLAKRINANIGIGMFTGDWCGGDGAWFDNVRYGNNNIGSREYKSVGISYRALRSDEQLDFSKTAKSDKCGNYRYSAGKQTPVGCFNSQPITCLRLTSTVRLPPYYSWLEGTS